jgi:hypothetical protein
MEIVLSHRPFDRIEAPIASLSLFQDRLPLRRAAGLVDWRMNGELSRLIENKRLEGRGEESLLMPTDGRLESRSLFLFGLGPELSWESRKIDAVFSLWVQKLLGLRERTWLLSFSELADDFLTWRNCLRTFVHDVLQCADFLPDRLILSEEPAWVLEAKKRTMDFGESVHLCFE